MIVFVGKFKYVDIGYSFEIFFKMFFEFFIKIMNIYW